MQRRQFIAELGAVATDAAFRSDRRVSAMTYDALGYVYGVSFR
jgi:hypothetical protein